MGIQEIGCTFLRDYSEGVQLFVQHGFHGFVQQGLKLVALTPERLANDRTRSLNFSTSNFRRHPKEFAEQDRPLLILDTERSVFQFTGTARNWERIRAAPCYRRECRCFHGTPLKAAVRKGRVTLQEVEDFRAMGLKCDEKWLDINNEDVN